MMAGRSNGDTLAGLPLNGTAGDDNGPMMSPDIDSSKKERKKKAKHGGAAPGGTRRSVGGRKSIAPLILDDSSSDGDDNDNDWDDDSSEEGGGRRKKTNKKSKRSNKKNVVSDDEDDGGGNAGSSGEGVVERLEPLRFSSGDEDEDDENEKSMSFEEARRLKRAGGGTVTETTPAASATSSKKKGSQQRRRRRSSARFLRLSQGRFDEEEEEDANKSKDTAELREVYTQAIRMNAENKINSANSWGLKLIENMSQFISDHHEDVEDDDDDEDSSGRKRGQHGRGGGGGEDGEPGSELGGDGKKKDAGKKKKKKGRVNFSKASCTLDASVKIYSYRVDDVHLTSYKVLANLNRTDNNENKSKGDGEVEERDSSGGKSKSSSARGRGNSDRRGTGSTLESNRANINVTKHDSAYDIDPLFHRMSKNFDEGGAKGLLLNNLGNGPYGCDVVFEDDKDKEVDKDGGDDNNEDATVYQDGPMDVSNLCEQFDAKSDGRDVLEIALIPSLQSVRDEYSQLHAEGYSGDKIGTTKKTKRYAITEEEEREAEISIHNEALERSRMSAANGTGRNSMASEDNFGPIDFGGVGFGDEDDDGGHDDEFHDFGGPTVDDGEGGYSLHEDTSGRSSSFGGFGGGGMSTSTQHRNVAALDMLCNGDATVNNPDSQYSYFDPKAVEKVMSQGNAWAGANHWKKMTKLRDRRKSKSGDVATNNDSTGAKKKKKRATKKKDKGDTGYVDLNAKPTFDIFAKPTKAKRSKADPLQQSAAVKRKNRDHKNLLPVDAGMDLDQLTRLFLRPDAKFLPVADNDGVKERRKTVGFHDVPANVMMFDDGVDDSFGDDDDGGPGFAFADDGGDTQMNGEYGDDFPVKALEGVRLVEKIEVGYAKVAKKIDVKRLKTELWEELDKRLENKAEVDDQGGAEELDEGGEDPVGNEEEGSRAEGPPTSPGGDETGIGSGPISFQRLVEDLEESQHQQDVSVPFYFICLLHLANEKGLELVSQGLEDFTVCRDVLLEKSSTKDR